MYRARIEVAPAPTVDVNESEAERNLCLALSVADAGIITIILDDDEGGQTVTEILLDKVGDF